MKQKFLNKRNKSQNGYLIVGVLVIMGICLLISANLLQSSSSSTSTRRVVKKNTENFYLVEKSINKVTAWLQVNSKNIVKAFDSTNFPLNFDLGSPVAGTNTGSFQIPTLVKMKGTTNSVQLTNSSYFGTSAFPNTTNIDTGAAYNAVNAFNSADFGSGVNVRLLMIWALATDGHYEPIFRVDAVTGGSTPEYGVHGINFIKSSLIASNGVAGYYAEKEIGTGTPNNVCRSYQYTWNGTTSTWTRGAARSNCIITSPKEVWLRSAIQGNVYVNTTAGITLDTGGSVSGTMCQAPGCFSYTLPTLSTWTTSCGGVGTNITATGTSASPTNITAGATMASRCYNTITIPSNKTVRFTTPNVPYYIKAITPQNNSNSRITFSTVGPGNKYILYVDNFTGGQLNGNQFVGTNLAPHQLEIYLTNTTDFTLNGTATMNGVFTGTTATRFFPNGNFSFFGALRGNVIDVLGNSVLGYDEALGGAPALSDINFTLYKASQRYR